MKSVKKHIKETINLSAPIVVAQLGYILMSVVDNAMVGRLGAVPLAAAAVSNGVFFLIMVFGLGISFAVTPLVAIAIGNKDFREEDTLFKNSLAINIVTSVILAATAIFASDLLNYLKQSPEVVEYAVPYFRILAFSIIPLMLFQSYKQFIEGLSIMRPAMVISLTANIVNAIANWILIYGNLGFPKLELNGAGWATFISRVYMMCAIIFFVKKSGRFHQFDLKMKSFKPDFPVMKKLLKLGIPGAFQYLFEVGAFAFAAVMVGWINPESLAAHQIAISLSSITYMVAMGISAAASVRVGNAVGIKNIFEIRRAGFTALGLSIGFMALSGIVFILFNHQLPTLYINASEVITIAADLLIIAALFQIFDGTQAVGIGILRGLTDVKIPTAITFLAYWVIALPLAYLLGFTFNFGIEGIWVGLLFGLFFSGLLLTIRFNIKSKKELSL